MRSLVLGGLLAFLGVNNVPADPAPAQVAPALRVVPLSTTSATARAAYLRGRALHRSGAQAKARDEYRAAVTADPAFARGHLALGTTLMGAEREQAFARAVELAATSSEPERRLIAAVVAGGRTPSTYSAGLRGVLALAPDDWEIHFQLGDAAQYIDGDLAAARAAYERAVALAPAEPGPPRSLAWLLSRQGAHDQALALARRQVAAFPDDVRANENLGWIAFRAGKLDDAERVLRASSTADEDLAYVRAFRGDLRGAIAGFERVLAAPVSEAQRGSQEGYFGRFEAARALAWLYVAAGRVAAVDPMLAKVERELADGKADGLVLRSRRVRAEILLDQNRPREAAAVLAAAVERAGANARSLRVAQLQLAVATRAAADVDKLAAALLAESSTDVDAARIRALVAQHRRSPTAIVAELPALRSDEERQVEAKLAAAELYAAAGQNADAARLRAEVRATFVPSGRIALLRARLAP